MSTIIQNFLLALLLLGFTQCIRVSLSGNDLPDSQYLYHACGRFELDKKTPSVFKAVCYRKQETLDLSNCLQFTGSELQQKGLGYNLNCKSESLKADSWAVLFTAKCRKNEKEEYVDRSIRLNEGSAPLRYINGKLACPRSLTEVCWDFRLNGTSLDLLCRGRNNQISTNRVDLSRCLGNENGRLTYGQNFSSSCKDCWLNNGILTCKCQDKNGWWGAETKVALNKILFFSGKPTC